MTRKKIEEILSSEEELMPSSGFLSAVMERVSEEAAAPPPIPFPWKRALPGMALIAGVFGWGAVELVRRATAAGGAVLPHAGADTTIAFAAMLHLPFQGAGWVALSLAIAWLSWALARKMAERG